MIRVEHRRVFWAIVLRVGPYVATSERQLFTDLGDSPALRERSSRELFSAGKCPRRPEPLFPKSSRASSTSNAVTLSFGRLSPSYRE